MSAVAPTPRAEGFALGCQPPAGEGDGIWIRAGTCGRIGGLSEHGKARLLSYILELRVPQGTRMVVLGNEVGGLGPAERAALRARVAFLPASGGLLSSLNAWENITLPLGFHDPAALSRITGRVYRVLGELGADPRDLLPKLPERMSLYEKKLTGYVRILTENPELVLVEALPRGLGPGERADTARFPEVYRAISPGGTFVHLEDPAESQNGAAGGGPASF